MHPDALEDAELAPLVAAQLGVPEVTITASAVEAHPYDRPALTTASRHVVTGTAQTPDGRVRDFAFFVKVIQAYQRSPLRFALPEPLRAVAAEAVPWRTEADVHRSDLRHRLPPGLSMPRAFAVCDLDEETAVLWLERIPERPVVWDAGRYATAAYLLGRFAASRAVAPLVTAVHGARTPRTYAEGWLDGVVRPALSEAAVWTHPLVREAFDARLRRRLDAAFDALPALLDELDHAPLTATHGDACPANLLVAADRGGLVLVDFGFCGRAPLGTDLSRLVLGDVGTGRVDLPALDAACFDAYTAGFAAEGAGQDVTRLRRIHALLMTVFAALPAVPVEHLDAAPTQALRRLSQARAATARYALDLLDHTPA